MRGSPVEHGRAEALLDQERRASARRRGYARTRRPSAWGKLAPLMAFLSILLSLPACASRETTSPEPAPALVNHTPPKSQAVTPRYGGTYRRPLGNEPVTLDPAHLADAYGLTVVQQLFDGLVRYDDGLAVHPALAESWRASRDGRVWTFSLRKGVTFHTGRPLEAADVVYSFTRLLAPQANPRAAAFFANVRGARAFIEGRAPTVAGLRALDAHTVQIALVEDVPVFVNHLAIGWAKIVPREVVEALGTAFGRRPVGTGPFRLVSWTPHQGLTLAANAEYYAGRPFLDRVEYRIFAGEPDDQMYARFRRQELDDAPVPPLDVAAVRQDPRVRFVTRPLHGITLLRVASATGPLATQALRQALNLALDREALARDVYQGRVRAAHAVLPPGVYGYEPQYMPYPFDPGRARALLAAAGFPNGAGLPVLEIGANGRSATRDREQDFIRRALAAVGIQVAFRTIPDWPAFQAQADAGTFPVVEETWTADWPDAEGILDPLIHAQCGTSQRQCSAADVDRLLKQAGLESNFLTRLRREQEVAHALMEDPPVIPLHYASYERVLQPFVRGFEVSALGDPLISMQKIWLAK